MKKSDVKIGSEYAYNRNEYGSAQRVRVLREAKIQQGWGYSQKTVSGWEVEVLDSKTGAPAVRPGNGEAWVMKIHGRTLREDWAPYWERQVALLASRRASERSAEEGRQQRAKFLLDLIPSLRESGVDDDKTIVYDLKVIRALQAHVDDCLVESGEGINERVELVAPYARALVEYVENGKRIAVPADHLLTFLAGRHL